ncbi:hypothetical protein ABFT51_20080 [Paenibacillus peoriae]|uniref:hypothetical protein n=1 Tax=Paenibacillus peoriae TaxID=59893 RepID=UPI0032AF6F30
MAETLAEIVDAPAEVVVLESPYTGEIREKARRAVKLTDSVFLIFFDLMNTFHLPLLGFLILKDNLPGSYVKSSQNSLWYSPPLKNIDSAGVESIGHHSEVNNPWCRP